MGEKCLHYTTNIGKLTPIKTQSNPIISLWWSYFAKIVHNFCIYIYIYKYKYICYICHIYIYIYMCVCIHINKSTSQCHRLPHPWSRDNEDHETFLAPSADKQTRNYKTRVFKPPSLLINPIYLIYIYIYIYTHIYIYIYLLALFAKKLHHKS